MPIERNKGEAISKENLLASLYIRGAVSAEKMSWLKEKIESADEDWRRQFVKTITGNGILSPGMRIGIGTCRRAGSFEIHTCFNSLDVPAEAMTKGAFYEALDAALEGEGYNTA